MSFTRDELLAAPVRHASPRAVRFQDVDAAGIVFYARFFEYFHDAYADYLAAHGSPLPEVIRAQTWAAPLVHAEADFLAPLRFGDAIEVALVAGRLEKSRLSVGYRLMKGPDACALGSTVHVFVDVAGFKKIPPPPEAVAALATLLG
jgi:YbgC/YbaW family acyl-CoA thioester hydrolase